jgi:hypothetical protein
VPLGDRRTRGDVQVEARVTLTLVGRVEAKREGER